jgi:hypothetical protein
VRGITKLLAHDHTKSKYLVQKRELIKGLHKAAVDDELSRAANARRVNEPRVAVVVGQRHLLPNDIPVVHKQFPAVICKDTETKHTLKIPAANKFYFCDSSPTAVPLKRIKIIKKRLVVLLQR